MLDEAVFAKKPTQMYAKPSLKLVNSQDEQILKQVVEGLPKRVQ